MATTFNIYNTFLELIDLGYNVSQIASLLNMYELRVKNSLRQLRENLIDEYTPESFEEIKKIDAVIGRYEIDSNYLDAVSLLANGNSNDVIQHYLGWGLERYLHILKSSYYFISTYGSAKNRAMLGVLKDSIEKTSNILESRNMLGKKRVIVTPIDKKALFGKTSRKLTESSASVRIIREIDAKDNLRFIAIADTHFGSEKENLDYLRQVYEYAAKHGIKIIFHAGDLLQGSIEQYRGCKKPYNSAHAQIDHLLRDYCYDKDISNYILLGNHDASIIYGEGIDVYDYLQYRSDFIPLGYKTGYIKVGEEYITIRHDVNKLYNSVKDENGFLNLYGHSHQYDSQHNNGEAVVKVPTLSDLSPGTLHKTNKGFLVSSVDLKDGYAVNADIDFVPVEPQLKRYIKK